jgi:hypothetical protein
MFSRRGKPREPAGRKKNEIEEIRSAWVGVERFSRNTTSGKHAKIR